MSKYESHIISIKNYNNLYNIQVIIINIIPRKKYSNTFGVNLSYV
jgi:hypothetical protein